MIVKVSSWTGSSFHLAVFADAYHFKRKPTGIFLEGKAAAPLTSLTIDCILVIQGCDVWILTYFYVFKHKKVDLVAVRPIVLRIFLNAPITRWNLFIHKRTGQTIVYLCNQMCCSIDILPLDIFSSFIIILFPLYKNKWPLVSLFSVCIWCRVGPSFELS